VTQRDGTRFTTYNTECICIQRFARARFLSLSLPPSLSLACALSHSLTLALALGLCFSRERALSLARSLASRPPSLSPSLPISRARSLSLSLSLFLPLSLSLPPSLILKRQSGISKSNNNPERALVSSHGASPKWPFQFGTSTEYAEERPALASVSFRSDVADSQTTDATADSQAPLSFRNSGGDSRQGGGRGGAGAEAGAGGLLRAFQAFMTPR
jgi:hypothetical protein